MFGINYLILGTELLLIGIGIFIGIKILNWFYK